MLIRKGKQSIEMKEGGWKEKASIATQAARVDYTHMRGPKIGAGLTREKELVVIAVNGRIRESVGATHLELAEILLDHGAYKAMGFDPGGSVTLVVDGKQLNISPYNKNYLQYPYSARPQPRFVGNAVMGVIEN
jgi:exopolysaccharide biosynthesis protein